MILQINNLPHLSGVSEKQIRYGEDCRRRFLLNTEKYLPALARVPLGMPPLLNEYVAFLGALIELHTEASWWIFLRNEFGPLEYIQKWIIAEHPELI